MKLSLVSGPHLKNILLRSHIEQDGDENPGHPSVRRQHRRKTATGQENQKSSQSQNSSEEGVQRIQNQKMPPGTDI